MHSMRGGGSLASKVENFLIRKTANQGTLVASGKKVPTAFKGKEITKRHSTKLNGTRKKQKQWLKVRS